MSEEREDFIYFTYENRTSGNAEGQGGSNERRKVQVSRETWERGWLNYWKHVERTMATEPPSEE